MKAILLISPILFALLRTVFSRDEKVYYIDKACLSKGTKVEYPLSETNGKETVAILKATKDWKKISEQDCFLSFYTINSSNKILFSVRRIDFKKPDCKKYYIVVESYRKHLTTLCDYKDDSQESVSYNSSKNRLDFHIVITEKVYADIELTVTAYSDVSTPTFNFKCNNNRYISSALTCDDHNNCGDRSDEMNCTKFTPGIISAIAIGCLLFIAAVAGAIWFFSRRGTSISTYTRRVYT